MIAHEAEVVVLAHDRRAASSPIVLTISSHERESQVVGIDRERDLLAGRDRPHHVRVALDGIQIRFLRE